MNFSAVNASLPEIALGDTIAANVQLAGHAEWRRLVIAVENMQLRVRDGLADRDRIVSGQDFAAGRPDRRFRWPVHVPQGAAALEESVSQVARQSLAAAQHLEPRPRAEASLEQQPPRSGRALHDRRSRAPDGGEQAVSVETSSRLAIATVAPTSKGVKSSSAAMSKAIVVIASSVSVRPTPGRCAMLHSRLTKERWVTSTPFGAPVDPDV